MSRCRGGEVMEEMDGEGKFGKGCKGGRGRMRSGVRRENRIGGMK